VENTRNEDEHGTPHFGIQRWEDTGHFFAGDSFIVLHTKVDAEGTPCSWDVYYWVGKDSTQDEYTVAAYKVVELDDLLGGKPVIFHESQGHESEAFLGLFSKGGKGCMLVEDGGVASGFRHLTDADKEAFPPRLFQFTKTRKGIKSYQVPLALSSLHQGDAFMLDTGRTVTVWGGAAVSPFERARAATVAHNVVIARAGHATLLQDADDAFWATLGGGGPDDVQPAPPDEDEVEAAPADGLCRVFRLCDKDTVMRHEEVPPPITRDALTSQDAYCLVAPGGAKVFVWVGGKATKGEASQALVYAKELLAEFQANDANDASPTKAQVVRVLEGQEAQCGLFEACNL